MIKMKITFGEGRGAQEEGQEGGQEGGDSRDP